MQTSETRAIVTDFYRALRERDRKRLLAILGDDVDWLVHSPAHIFPFSGWRRGREGVIEAVRHFTREYEMSEYRQDVMIVEGARAAVISNSAFRQRATERMLRFSLVDFTRFENGRLVEFRQFLNSFDLVEQALGRELDVGFAP